MAKPTATAICARILCLPSLSTFPIPRHSSQIDCGAKFAERFVLLGRDNSLRKASISRGLFASHTVHENLFNVFRP